MHFDFFGIPIDGTPPQFVEKLLRNGRLDTTQGIQNVVFDVYTIQIYLAELFCSSVSLDFTVNTYTSMVYDASISIDDIGLSNYSRLFDIVVERYGTDFVKLPGREAIIWYFKEGNIHLFRNDTTTVLSFTDNANDPNNPENGYADINDEEDIKLIE